MEQYLCQVCGKCINEDVGITTLNGLFVCDDISCRTLDSDNQAIEREVPLRSVEGGKHPLWCGKPCAECNSPCGLDESMPCSPDCNGFDLAGNPGHGPDCIGCDAIE